MGRVGLTSRFRVYGEPVPQGSKVAFNRGGRVVLLEGKGPRRAAFNEWRERVAMAADYCRTEEGLPLYDGPLRVVITFDLPKPKSVRRARPSVRPDVDKLARAVLDGLTGSIIVDDSRVVDLHALKAYASSPGDVGATITVEAVA